MRGTAFLKFTARGLAAIACTVAILATSVQAASASTLNGVATIVDPSTNTPLASGGSAQLFTITLPSQAKCSGDTATNGYHVWSYLIPKPTTGTIQQKVLAINFVSLAGYFPIFEQGGSYYGPANTAIGTGQIVSVPLTFQWEALNSALGGGTGTSSLLKGKSSFTYDGGLACTNSANAASDFWNFQVTFTKKSSDPGGFTWTDIPGEPLPAPKVKSVSPTSGTHLGGTLVTVTGANFTGATQVLFGTTAGTTLTIVSASKLTIHTPAHTTGIVDVRVTTSSGTSKVVTTDKYTFT